VSFFYALQVMLDVASFDTSGQWLSTVTAARRTEAAMRIQSRGRVLSTRYLFGSIPSIIAALLAAGHTPTELRAVQKVRASTLLAASVDVGALYAAGYSARELHDAGVSVHGLCSAGYSLVEVMEALGAAELAYELAKAGFSLSELRKASTALTQCTLPPPPNCVHSLLTVQTALHCARAAGRHMRPFPRCSVLASAYHRHDRQPNLGPLPVRSL
jgi:hypothetical protein